MAKKRMKTRRIQVTATTKRVRKTIVKKCRGLGKIKKVRKKTGLIVILVDKDTSIKDIIEYLTHNFQVTVQRVQRTKKNKAAR